MNEQSGGITASIMELTAPWAHLSTSDASTVTNEAWRLSREREGFAVRIVRGKKMKTLDGLFNEWAAALQFPFYFGENWNALKDCITDLDWLNAKGYLIVILDADSVLCDAPDCLSQMESLLEMLRLASSEWAMPIERGETWDRTARPFRVVFQTTRGNEMGWQARLSDNP